jgi:2-deoxy-D-gluconate 3-dehydrogenase
MNSNEKIAAFNMDYFSLKGKVAIVTGANQGLGMGYAVAFAKAGADLYIPHFTEDVSDVKRLIEAEGRRVAFIRGDLTDRTYLKAVVEGCLKEYGHIDILVNNAGNNHFAPFLEFPRRGVRPRSGAPAEGRLLPRARGRQGHGQAGRRQDHQHRLGALLYGDRMCPAYVTSKHGVIGITRDFANELGQYNIQTNAICPGFIQTDIISAISSDPSFTDHITAASAGRWATWTI